MEEHCVQPAQAFLTPHREQQDQGMEQTPELPMGITWQREQPKEVSPSIGPW